ncbi:putative membrane mmpL5 domain protein [Mycobacterium xenopi 4042]|uniref:Putative membrane mmpL5 domain protein n=1 Tax=Mycobacterium xenopi 4042 TaxID=1299334 RepID=X8ED85_MYCXE|nr:putative membrane mmpL5 domain protein [Mycobacterium xenopi 4042]
MASHFGLLEPRRAMRIRGWRKIGAAVVRWPAPVLAATVAIALVGLITLPSYRPATTTAITCRPTSRRMWDTPPRTATLPRPG